LNYYRCPSYSGDGYYHTENSLEPERPIGETEFDISPTIKFITFFATLAAVAGIYFQLNEFYLNRIQSSWGILQSTASGNTGKGMALEYLYNRGYNIVGIDVSCSEHSLFEEEPCEQPQIITEFNLYNPGIPSAVVRLFADGATFARCSSTNQPIILIGQQITFSCDLNRSALELRGKNNTVFSARFNESVLNVNGNVTFRQVQAQKLHIQATPNRQFDGGVRKIKMAIVGSALSDSEIRVRDGQSFLVVQSDVSGVLIHGLGTVIIDERGSRVFPDPRLAVEQAKALADVFSFENSWYWDDNPPKLDIRGQAVPFDRFPNPLHVCPSGERDISAGSYETVVQDDQVSLYAIKNGVLSGDPIACS
jgi:surface antigen